MSQHPELNLLITTLFKPFNIFYDTPVAHTEYRILRALTENTGSFCSVSGCQYYAKKAGFFVSLWKRNSNGIVAPYDTHDAIDMVLIMTQAPSRCGLFVFPRSVLEEKGIITTSQREGKRGLRVYTPWDTPSNQQALSTQKWQIMYFIDLTTDIGRSQVQHLLAFRKKLYD